MTASVEALSARHPHFVPRSQCISAMVAFVGVCPCMRGLYYAHRICNLIITERFLVLRYKQQSLPPWCPLTLKIRCCWRPVRLPPAWHNDEAHCREFLAPSIAVLPRSRITDKPAKLTSVSSRRLTAIEVLTSNKFRLNVRTLTNTQQHPPQPAKQLPNNSLQHPANPVWH